MHLFSNRARLAAAGLITVSLTLVVGPAQAHHNPLTPRTHFTMQADGSSGATEGGAGIPNIDSVKKTIATYYGDTGNGISNKESSPYITEMDTIIRRATKELKPVRGQATAHHKKPAIVFDADDTTLWTYDMEAGAMHFNFDPALQDVWVQDERFPATPAMVKFVARAAKLGYTVFGLTGRSDDQKAATLGNLTKDGYQDFTADRFYTKWTGAGTSQQPSYIHCALAKCTTVEFKSQTRKHIESLGYDIKLNVGDQFSDLQGGYSDKTLKLPNPTYYLP
jgi:hypothetical protein